jgi:membrane protein DedA with SNARE-associated domain
LIARPLQFRQPGTGFSRKWKKALLRRRLPWPYGEKSDKGRPAPTGRFIVFLVFTALTHDIAHLIHVYGLVVVALVIGFESIGLPFPGETVLILAAIFAGTKHDLNIVAVVVTAAAAAIAGQVIGFVIGREFGYRLLLRYGPYLHVTEGRIKLGEYLFLRHGSKIVFIARFVPVMRSIAGILAGANRMPWTQFLVANVVGAFAWASVFGFAAYTFGHEIEHVAGPIMIVIGIIVVILLVIGAVFISRHEAQLIAEAERALPGPLKRA